MALAEVSTGDKDAIRTFFKGLKDVRWHEHTGAHEPDQSYAGRILHSSHAGEIRTRIRTPVTGKSYDLGIKFC